MTDFVVFMCNAMQYKEEQRWRYYSSSSTSMRYLSQRTRYEVLLTSLSSLQYNKFNLFFYNRI